MLSLSEYDKLALKILSNWKKRRGCLKITDELMGTVVRYMAIADWKYDESKAKNLSRHQCRQMRAIYAIRTYIKTKKTSIPFDDRVYYREAVPYNDKSGKKAQFMINNAALNQHENKVIDLFISGLSIPQIAEQLNISYSKCRNLYDSAIGKMKRISLNKEGKC